MQKKTGRQGEILSFISSYIRHNGCPPTYREIGEEFSFSASAAYCAVKALEKKGYLELRRDSMRNILLPESEREERENCAVPFYEKEPSEEDLSLFPEKTMLLPRALGENVFAYRVTSTSMNNAGILKGDIAVIRKCTEAENNQIVLALREEGMPLELRRLHIASSYAELWAENDTMGIIRRKNFTLYGVLIEIRRYY